MADLARYDVEEYGVAEPTHHDTEERGGTELAHRALEESGVPNLSERQRAVRCEPAGPEGHPNDNQAPLPDYTGADLTALRARVDHPVLGAVLATLLARSCSADGGLVAYHEDSPGAER